MSKSKKKYYYKLIRDKMISKIEKDGHKPIFQVLTKSELKNELREKLLEIGRASCRERVSSPV